MEQFRHKVFLCCLMLSDDNSKITLLEPVIPFSGFELKNDKAAAELVNLENN